MEHRDRVDVTPREWRATAVALVAMGVFIGWGLFGQPGLALSTNWGDLGTWFAGSASVVVGYLAWRTSQRAVQIARQQHDEMVLIRKENARILGRLLQGEIRALPARLDYVVRAWDAAIEWSDFSIKNGHAFETALKESQMPVLPAAEMSETRIHYLPDHIGVDLATLISLSRSMNHIAGRVAARVRPPGLGPGTSNLPNYAGDRKDFDNLVGCIRFFRDLSTDFVPEFDEFVRKGFPEQQAISHVGNFES